MAYRPREACSLRPGSFRGPGNFGWDLGPSTVGNWCNVGTKSRQWATASERGGCPHSSTCIFEDSRQSSYEFASHWATILPGRLVISGWCVFLACWRWNLFTGAFQTYGPGHSQEDTCSSPDYGSSHPANTQTCGFVISIYICWICAFSPCSDEPGSKTITCYLYRIMIPFQIGWGFIFAQYSPQYMVYHVPDPAPFILVYHKPD